MKILVTGMAGFIGFHVAQKLVDLNHMVVGFDDLNDYYDVNLKFSRLNELGITANEMNDGLVVRSDIHGDNLQFVKGSLQDHLLLENVFGVFQFDYVCHLAAQAGVRYSIDNPRSYIDSNIVGFLNILECCRQFDIGHLVYASSSSVYGLREIMPLSVTEPVDHPVSLYAATKKSNELMAHSYSHLYSIPSTGLRFFTVYGPWGRPDMSPMIFASSIKSNKAIKVYNYGKMMRDFTYIDDVVEAITRVIFSPAQSNQFWNQKIPDLASSSAPYRIYNIGNSNPVNLLDFIEIMESHLNKKAILNLQPLQPGDVLKTYADIKDFESHFDFKPSINLEVGMQKFIKWFNSYYIH